MYYKNTFLKAYNRTLELGLIPPKIQPLEKSYLSNNSINDISRSIYENFGVIKIKELYRNCMGIHYKLKPFFEKLFETEVYLTLGNAWIEDQAIFKITEPEIENYLISKIKKPLNIHAWLTLPSMEIIDFSLSTTYAIEKNVKEMLGAVIIKHPNDLTGGMKYEPMLIGYDFLRKSGGMFEFP